MEKIERVYELSYIISSEYDAERRDILTRFSRGSLMVEKLKASNKKGEFVLGEDPGEIREVHFLRPELNTVEMHEKIGMYKFNHKEKDGKKYSYQEFLSLGQPMRIKVTVGALETLV